ncbi:MAG: DUF4446 family protein [Candidatus Paceibacterota bacterium]|jgi:hypothetical protein
MSGIIDSLKENQGVIVAGLVAFSAVILAWNIYLQRNLSQIKKRSRVFFESKEAKDLEEIIFNQIKNANEAKVSMEKMFIENADMKKKLDLCIQKVGVVRFNPFAEVGGNQSFAIALLDKHLSGVIILSLYARDGVRVYSKALKDGKSEYRLSKEEEEAVKLASTDIA